MTQAQTLASLFGQEAVTSCAPSEIAEDAFEASLALAAGQALLEDLGEEPTLVTETGEGFLISGDRHVIFMGADGTTDQKEIDPDAVGEHVGHDQEELNRWFYEWQFPDHATHILAKQLAYDILQSRSGGATDGVWMRELYRRTASGKYAALRQYLTPTVIAYGSGQMGESAGEADDLSEDMPRELSLDDFFHVDNFPDYATAQRASQALEAARESTDTATENAMAKKLYAIMPRDLRKYMHDDFRRMLAAESTAPVFTRVVWESDGEDAPTIHVLEDQTHRLLLTPQGSDLHGFTEDDLKWLLSGAAAREVYGLDADADYVYVRDDDAQQAAQALTELGYEPTLHATLDETETPVGFLALIEGGITTADLLTAMVGATAAPQRVLDAHQQVQGIADAGLIAEEAGQYHLTEAGQELLHDPALQALIPTTTGDASVGRALAERLLDDIDAHADTDAEARRLHRRVIEALRTHGRHRGYVTENADESVDEAKFSKQHFQAFAAMLRSEWEGEGHKATLKRLAAGMARIFKASNPAFQASMFTKAAGMPPVSATSTEAGEEMPTEAFEDDIPDLAVMEDALVAVFATVPPTDQMRPYMAAFDAAKAEDDAAKARVAYEAIFEFALGTLTEATTQDALIERVLVTAKTPGITGLPDDAWKEWSVGKLVKHFRTLGGQIGKAPAMRTVLNIERWNKTQDPKLSAKARTVIDQIKESAGSMDEASLPSKINALKAAKQQIDLQWDDMDWTDVEDQGGVPKATIVATRKALATLPAPHEAARIRSLLQQADDALTGMEMGKDWYASPTAEYRQFQRAQKAVDRALKESLDEAVPKWPGAEKVYGALQRVLAVMAKKGHATAAVTTKRGRILAPGSVSDEMRDLIDALNRGDEEQLKALQAQYRFRYPEAFRKIKEDLDEQDKIDRAAVKKAAMKAATTLFGKPDESIVNSMIDNAIQKKGAKDTEDAIQMVVAMMRSKGESAEDDDRDPDAAFDAAQAADGGFDIEDEDEDEDSVGEAVKRLGMGARRARLRALRKPMTPERKRQAKARRLARKRQAGKFRRQERRYRKIAKRGPKLRPMAASVGGESVEIDMDILTVPAEAVDYYVELSRDAGWEPVVEETEDGFAIHLPHDVADVIEEYTEDPEAFVNADGADDDLEEIAHKKKGKKKGNPHNNDDNDDEDDEEDDEEPEESLSAADLAIAGALQQLQKALPESGAQWGEAKRALTFLLGNGMVAEAKALVAGLQANDLSAFNADLSEGETVVGPYAFGKVTLREAMVALTNLHARVSGETAGLRESSVPTLLDQGWGRKVSDAAFAAAVADIEPTEEEPGNGLTFQTYECDGEVIGQAVLMAGKDPVYLLATLPEGAEAAWQAVLEGTHRGGHPQRGPQPKPPVDDGAPGTPKDVAEGGVAVRVPQADVAAFLEVAEQAGAPADAAVRPDGAHIIVTLPEDVAERVLLVVKTAEAVTPEPVLVD